MIFSSFDLFFSLNVVCDATLIWHNYYNSKNATPLRISEIHTLHHFLPTRQIPPKSSAHTPIYTKRKKKKRQSVLKISTTIHAKIYTSICKLIKQNKSIEFIAGWKFLSYLHSNFTTEIRFIDGLHGRVGATQKSDTVVWCIRCEYNQKWLFYSSQLSKSQQLIRITFFFLFCNIFARADWLVWSIRYWTEIRNIYNFLRKKYNFKPRLLFIMYFLDCTISE